MKLLRALALLVLVATVIATPARAAQPKNQSQPKGALLLKNGGETHGESTSVPLAWGAIDPAYQVTSYHVYDDTGGGFTQVGAAAETSFTAQNLSVGSHRFMVRAVNRTGEGPVGNVVEYTVDAPLPLPPAVNDLHRVASGIANISTRAQVGVGENVEIAGVIITGTTTPVVFRAIGPSLFAAGIHGPLIDPQLEIYDASGTMVATNDDWQTGATTPVPPGLEPKDGREAVVTTSLVPGAYTAIVRGKNQTSGVALVEIYRNDLAVAAL